jgi:hypothetical protein
MVGERPKPFGEAFGFDPITSTLIFQGDAVEAAHAFIAMCTGRFWSQGLFGVRPPVTKARA